MLGDCLQPIASEKHWLLEYGQSPSSISNVGVGVVIVNAVLGSKMIRESSPSVHGAAAQTVLPVRAWGSAARYHRLSLKTFMSAALEVQNLLYLYSGVFLQALGNGACQAVEMDYLHNAYHASSFLLQSLIACGCAVGLAFVSFATKWVTKRAGEAGLAVTGHLCGCAMYAVLAAQFPWWLVALLVVIGTSSDQAASCGASSALCTLAPRSIYGIGLGLQHSSSAAGLLLGPLIGEGVYALDHRLPFLVAFTASGLAALATQTIAAECQTRRERHSLE